MGYAIGGLRLVGDAGSERACREGWVCTDGVVVARSVPDVIRWCNC